MTATGSALRECVIGRLRAAGCVFAEEEAELLLAGAAGRAELSAMVARRAAGQPLEHVLGWAAFCGARIAVDAGVFVPRRRTEFLVRQAIELIRAGEWRTGGPTGGEPAGDDHRPPGPAARPVVVDLCCGSGAVGAAVAAASRPIDLFAVDIDPAAVRCAHGNLAAVGAQVYEGDLYAPLPATLRGRVDLLVANAPYVPAGEIRLMPGQAQAHEPRLALDGGPDGLDVLRRVIAEAPRWLAAGAHLLVETSAGQALRLAEVLARHRLSWRIVRDDEYDATVIVGARAGARRPAA